MNAFKTLKEFGSFFKLKFFNPGNAGRYSIVILLSFYRFVGEKVRKTVGNFLVKSKNFVLAKALMVGNFFYHQIEQAFPYLDNLYLICNTYLK